MEKTRSRDYLRGLNRDCPGLGRPALSVGRWDLRIRVNRRGPLLPPGRGMQHIVR